MNPEMQLVPTLEPNGEPSPLARTRLHRKLTLTETARRAGLSEEEARWLEEGRIYRFPNPDDALVATLLYVTALGIDNEEARELLGRPTLLGPARQSRLARLIVLGAILVALAVLAALLLVPHMNAQKATRVHAAGPVLPPPWRIKVNVLNGSGDINYTRRVASRIQGIGYTISHVGKADSFGYLQTAVYFPPGCDAVALRLAKQLEVATKPLPGGTGPCRLWVIVGPARGPGD
jgi:transcriptional regulator with XRE-family HTH domain